jgi:predicted transcriptional regulator
MKITNIASREEWLAARLGLLAQEKTASRQLAALAALRRDLPAVEIEKDYVFEGPDGTTRLIDLFEGRAQLIVYHFMWLYDIDDGCPSLRLAFVAALQVLPPRQRAVLILRDVLQWRSSEVASLLGLSVAAVNSALQRARARLPADHDTLVEPSEPRQRALLDRYVAAFENADVESLVAVLTEDAVFEMPPFSVWFRGSAAIGTFLAARMRELGGASVIRTSANGQPALALYTATRGGERHLHALHVLTVVPEGVSRVVAYQDPHALRCFNLPTSN